MNQGMGPNNQALLVAHRVDPDFAWLITLNLVGGGAFILLYDHGLEFSLQFR